MILFSHTITPRLEYIADFIRKETGLAELKLTNQVDEFRNSGDHKINYSRERLTQDEYCLYPHPLLFEKDIREQDIRCFEINNIKAFFNTGGDFPFDIFAASFYLLSRYEEYLPHQKDKYGRYAHENSLACKENFLHLPLVNIWTQYFAEKLKQKFPSLIVHHAPFTFIPTYDIDEMFCYLHKPSWKSKAGHIRSFLNNDKWEIKERKDVLAGLLPDPYDSFDWIKSLHASYHYLEGIVFFLVAQKNGKYDKNISPYKEEFRNKITGFFDIMPQRNNDPHPDLKAGLHPSWQSGERPGLIIKERDLLQYGIGMEVQCSRQHYIRFTLPQTFRHLLAAGIWSDYSMGYGSINGFRASVASPFYWYDLEKEEKTGLQLYPFCFMDANSFFEQKQTPQQALEEMMRYFEVIKSVNGTMITIWHNTFLGIHRRFAGWREVYKEFISRIYFQVPYVKDKVDKEGMDKKHFLS